eukprot:2054389-Pyramimonas_sp.AAC.1
MIDGQVGKARGHHGDRVQVEFLDVDGVKLTKQSNLRHDAKEFDGLLRSGTYPKRPVGRPAGLPRTFFCTRRASATATSFA